MNTIKMAEAAGSFAGSFVKAASQAHKAGQVVANNAQKAGQAVENSAQKLAAKTNGIVDKAGNAVGAASDIVEKTNGVITSSGELCTNTAGILTNGIQTIEQAKNAKDTFVKHVAQSKMDKVLGTNKPATVQGQMEIIRQQKIDPNFSSANDLFTRIKNVFVPKSFPSGKKVPLGKAQVSEISYSMEKGKTMRKSFKNADGDVFTFKIKGKPTEMYHEPAYTVNIKHVMPDGGIERAESIYFPQSAEIRGTGIDRNGLKTCTFVQGNENGGTIKTVTPKAKSHK